ncbi:MAG: hypothetical protein KDA51_04105 [Planctomycetales bacterium]|nr:hypothetical protein [Planctomycetales bacterium]
MATLRLDGQLLHALLATRLPGGVPEVQARWSLHDRSGLESKGPPHRATFHRWTQGQVPRTADDLLRLSGILDVDPICLLKLPERNPEATMERLASTYVHGRWEPPALEFLQEFMGRRAAWPPPSLARDYFGRDWHKREITHDATDRTNFYATLRIAPLDGSRCGGPFVYHVAFRHTSLFGKRWLQYGLVLRHGNRISLRHINGHIDGCDARDALAPNLVETWFGPSPAVFCVASLHPFTLDLIEAGPTGEPVVRFPG